MDHSEIYTAGEKPKIVSLACLLSVSLVTVAIVFGALAGHFTQYFSEFLISGFVFGALGISITTLDCLRKSLGCSGDEVEITTNPEISVLVRIPELDLPPPEQGQCIKSSIPLPSYFSIVPPSYEQKQVLLTKSPV